MSELKEAGKTILYVVVALWLYGQLQKAMAASSATAAQA